MPINFIEDPPATNRVINFIPDEHLPSPVQNLNQTMMDKILGSPALIKGLGYGENILSGLSDPKNILNRALGIRPVESTHFTEQDIKGGVPLPGPFIGAVNPSGGVSKPIDPNSIIGALRLLPDNVVDAITANPEQIALGGSGGVAALARKLMAIAMVTQGGSQVIKPNATPGERVRGGAQAVLGGLVGGIKEPVKPTTAQGEIEPSEFKKAGVESPEGNVIMPQYQNRPNAPQLNAPGINEAFARAQEMEKTAKALQTPARQLPEKAQGPLEQAKQEALDKLQRSQELPSEGGFIAGKTKIAPSGDAVKVSELTRPIGFIEDRKPVVELPKEEPPQNKPPFISGAVNPTGDVGVTPVTKEMLEANSGAKPPLNKDEAAKLFHDNLVTLGYAMRGEDQEHAQQLWKRNEQIKNDWFGGQTPEVPVKKEVQQEMKLNSGIPIDWEDIKKRVGIGEGDWTHQGVKIAMTDSGFKNPDVSVDAGQLKNRVLNKLNPESSEAKTWKGLGIDEKFKQGELTTPSDMARWMTENGPKVEVRKFGKGNLTPEQKEYNELEHSFDSIHPTAYTIVRAYAEGRTTREDMAHTLKLSNEELRKADRLKELVSKGLFEQPSQQSHWQSIAPKSEKDMPGYVEIAVVKPSETYEQQYKRTGKFPEYNATSATHVAPQFPSSHNFPPNTLGFVRGYMETGKNGEKTFHVIEVQSDWAQQLRDRQDTARQAGRYTGNDIDQLKDPLLPHYERLALKAAIEHARSEGATKIAISDAETAMMTEGHDRLAKRGMAYSVDDHTVKEGDFGLRYSNGQMQTYRSKVRALEDLARIEKENTPEKLQRMGLKLDMVKPEDLSTEEVAQSPGMRLHYDQTLPKIASELTGSKGDRVEFGEHRMAYNTRDTESINEGAASPRKDLIFRNPNGTPKTSVTARAYDISKPSARLASGEPQTQMQKLYSGVELPKEITDSIKRALGFVKQGNFTPLDRLPDKPVRVNPEAPTKLEESLSKAKTTPIESRDVSRAQPGEKLSLTDASKNVANNILNKLSYADKMLMPIDAIVDRLDSNAGDYKGWLQENVRKPIDDRFKYELNLRDSMLDPVTGLVKKYKMNEQNAERIGVYAHSLQKNGTERMLKSGVTQETIDKVLKTITPEEKLVYNTMRQMMDNSLPAVQSVMKELYNQDVKPVENYFPMPRDYNTYEAEPDSIAQGEFDEHGTWRQLQGDYVPRGAKTEQGFTITRKPGAKTAIKVNAFDIYQQHIRDVSHLIAMQKELHEIGKTVRRDMFKEKYGDVGQKLMLDWLNTVARQGKSGKQIAFLDAIRNNTSKSIIGFRLASQLVHSANVPLAIQRAGLLNWSKGLSESLSDRGYDFLKENFPETFERGGGEPSLVDVSKSKSAGWVFGLQRAIDRANTQATVLGVYMKELAEKGKNPNAYDTLPVDKDAQSKALILARRAVASPLYKDIPPALARGGSLGKMFFQFQNTFLDQWSNIRHDLISAGIGPKVFKNPALASQLTVALGAMMLIETGIKFGAKNIGLVATGNQPEGSDAFWKRLETDALRRVPGAGQLMSEVLYGETGIPTVDVATGAVKGGIEATTGKKIGVNVKEAKTEKGKESQEVTREKVREQALVNAITSALELAGIPGTSQISELIKNRIKASTPVKDNGNEKGNPEPKVDLKT